MQFLKPTASVVGELDYFLKRNPNGHNLYLN